jgi:hypothetical protein
LVVGAPREEALAELQKRPPDPTKRVHRFSALPIADGMTVYAEDRRSSSSAVSIDAEKPASAKISALAS